jgi:8-oxo-dGTP diphosphatase
VAPTSIADRVHRAALAGFQALPRRVRAGLVHLGAPSFTVGTMCVIEDDAGRLLLVRNAYRRGWGLPGGLIKRKETPEDCARREVREEVGLAIQLIAPAVPVLYPRYRRIDLVYRARAGRAADNVAVAPASPEVVETGWFAADDLPDLQYEARRALALF